MVDSVSYLPTELTGAALQMGQYYKLHHIKPSSAYSPDVLCSQKYSFPTVSKRELMLVCSLHSCLHCLFMGYTPQTQRARAPLQKPSIKPHAGTLGPVQCNPGVFGGDSGKDPASPTWAWLPLQTMPNVDYLSLSSSGYGFLLTQGQRQGIK